MDIDLETGEVIELPESPENAPELSKVKSDDALRIELINEVCKGFDTPQNPEELTWCGATRNQWAELYESASSDSEWADLDSDNELPW